MVPLLFTLALLTAAEPARWPGFLGLDATPLDATAIPLAWSPQNNLAWQSPLPGHGQSSPVIWGDRVFVTSVEGATKETCHVLCLNLADAQQRWRQSLASSDPVKNSLYVSRAAPTPMVDQDRVYVYFESGDVAAFDHDGQQVWRRALSQDYGKFQNEFGLGASPVQTADRLIVLVDHQGPSYLIALSKQTGETLWKTERASRTSWSSPSIVIVEGRPQVVCSSAGSVDGYDPETGRLLWTYGDVGGNTAATPLDCGNGTFLVGASPGREGDNAENARRSNFLMSVRRQGDGWTTKIVWKTEQAVPSFGSPIVYRDCAYWVNRAGVVYCLDAKTGQPHYTQRIAQSCWATPLGVGDRVYVFGKDGITTVLAAGPEFKVLAENRLWDRDAPPADRSLPGEEETEERRRAAAMFSGPTQYGVAAVDGSLLVRTGTVLYCVRDNSR